MCKRFYDRSQELERMQKLKENLGLLCFMNHIPMFRFIITSVACAIGPSVNLSSTDFFLPKPGFWGFI
jgi:hypothetical protein